MRLPDILSRRFQKQTIRWPAQAGRGPRRHRLQSPKRVVVVGGGIAGLAAATIAAERGAAVTLLERNGFLGGRAGSWKVPGKGDGGGPDHGYEMERGFHAFFRQYYNLRSLIRRVDPELSVLKPLEDYPILGPEGMRQSFHGLPRWTPANLVDLVRRSPYLGVRDLPGVNVPAAVEMLTYEGDATYARRDADTAGGYLDSLHFPDTARRMLFDVFAHSFFNPEEDMSAGEMLMMFHFYFTGNPEGLVFDVTRRPLSTALWEPLGEQLASLGACVERHVSVERVERAAAGQDARWNVVTTRDGERTTIEADAVVLALSVPGLKRLVEASPDLAAHAPLDRAVRSLDVTSPFYVLRLWLDRPVRAARAPFAGTTGVGELDNISVYNTFQDESAAWAEASGGAVVELHAYAVPEDMDEAALRANLLDGLHTFYPETRDAKILGEHGLLRRDCAAFRPGSYAPRPGVDAGPEGVALAGDFVRLPFPSALMEKAATTGILAANAVLASYGVEPEPVETIPPAGLLSKPCPASVGVDALARLQRSRRGREEVRHA